MKSTPQKVRGPILVWACNFRNAARRYRALLTLFGLQLIVSAGMCATAHRPLVVGVSDAFFTIDGAIVLFGAMALAVMLVRSRPQGVTIRRGYRLAFFELRRRVMTPGWIASTTMLAIVLPLSLAIFSAAKRAIPVVEPFRWDLALEEAGVRLHGGRHAWQWLQPIVGQPALTVALDRYYHVGWSLIVLGALALTVVGPVSRYRRRFVTAWVALTFVCGTVGAVAFSSAGPPYFARVTHRSDPYAPLRFYLRSVNEQTPLLSVGGRRALWAAYEHRVDAFGFGVSAMPSMHIATVTLVACLGWAVAPWVGAVTTAAAGIMLVGSVALLWHYAIDGYAGALLAVLIWWAAGRLTSDEAAPAALR